MTDATIATVRGRAATLDDAVREAALLLQGARCPVIAGLGTDAGGAEAAASLARACDGVLDHQHADALLRDLGAMREYGWIVATPPLVRARADTVLLVGPGLDGFALPPTPTLHPAVQRRVFRFAPDATLARLGVLRARAAGRPVSGTADPGGELDRLAASLREARYGVAVWASGALAELELEALCGLISDLNAETRWAGMALAPPGNARGVAQALGWTTGFPVRVGFERGRAEHHPARYDASRMVERGEADVAVWVQAIEPAPPSWSRLVPLVAVTGPGVAFASAPEVAVTVGRPGLDHEGILFSAEAGTLVAVRPEAPRDGPRVEDVLRAIAEALDPGSAGRC